MSTRFQDEFNVSVPIVLPGMAQVSVPALVAAVAQAGGLGLIATASLSPDEVEQAISEVRVRTNAAFGVGIPLMLPDAKEKVEAAIRARVPVVNFALGNGAWLIDEVHAYGGKVIATVASEKHARAAVRAGADALLVTGHEAAGHGGRVTSLVLVPRLAQTLDTHIIAAGGFCDGHGLAAALALGASAVAMGTRFALSAESPLHPDSKLAIRERSIEQTLYTDKFDGMDCRIMETPAAISLVNEKPSLPKALRAARDSASESTLPSHKLYTRVLQKGSAHVLKLARMASAGNAMQRALLNGDHETGIQPVGQAMGLIDDEPDVATLIERIMREAREQAATVNNALNPNGRPPRNP